MKYGAKGGDTSAPRAVVGLPPRIGPWGRRCAHGYCAFLAATQTNFDTPSQALVGEQSTSLDARMTPNNAVVLLEMFRQEELLATGTGVLYRKGYATFIVTAWHNVTGRHSETLQPLSGGLPDRVTAHIAKTLIASDGKFSGVIRQPIDLRLEDAEQTQYFVHAQGFPRVDVVAIPIDPDEVYSSRVHLSDGRTTVTRQALRHAPNGRGLGGQIECIQDFAGASAQFNVDFANHLSVTDDVFVVGYPKGLTDQTLQPIWKRATVATEPRLGWQGQRKFLVDCASRQGLSGAPVLSYNKTGRMQVGGMTYVGSGPAIMLHGVYVSRLGGGREFEAQIGTVWSRSVIDEIIEAEVRGPLSDDQEVTNIELREFVRERWPAAEGDDYADAIINGQRPSGYFSYNLAKQLKGRAGFDRIDAMVREIGQSLCDEASGCK